VSTPPELAARLFHALYDGYDLLTDLPIPSLDNHPVRTRSAPVR
jgi:hypothetical protein